MRLASHPRPATGRAAVAAERAHLTVVAIPLLRTTLVSSGRRDASVETTLGCWTGWVHSATEPEAKAKALEEAERRNPGFTLGDPVVLQFDEQGLRVGGPRVERTVAP